MDVCSLEFPQYLLCIRGIEALSGPAVIIRNLCKSPMKVGIIVSIYTRTSSSSRYTGLAKLLKRLSSRVVVIVEHGKLGGRFQVVLLGGADGSSERPELSER